jgi:putative DNA primase/helicase
MMNLENIADAPRPMFDTNKVDSKAREVPWLDVLSDIPQGFRLGDDGLYRKTDNSEGRVSGAVWVSTKTRDPEGEDWGIVVEWIDPDNKRHKQAFPRNLLHDRKGISLVQALSAGGLEVIPGCENALVKYLGSFEIPNRLRSVAQLGWLNGEELVFVLPERVIGNGTNAKIVYQPERYSPTSSTTGSRGTLAQWQMNVATPCKNNDYLIFVLCQSFAGALLEFSNIENGGFHLYGASSKGKTTALQCAASVWGNGADPAASHETYIRKWNTTANALEATAASHNDGILILDELGTCSAQDIGKVIYDLFGGQGKARMGKDASLLSRRSWRFMGLSSGEVSVDQRIKGERGRESRAGQLIRFLDIPIDGGIIRDGHGQVSGVFVRQLKQSCAKFYGTAGAAFLNKFVSYFVSRDQAMRDVCKSVEHWATAVAADYKGLTELQARALDRFALLKCAGELAVEFEILPFSLEEIDESVLHLWKIWHGDSSNLSDADRGVRNVREFLQKHGASRFDSDKSHETLIRDRAGYRHKDLFLFTDVGFKEACGEFDIHQVAVELIKRGFLAVDDHTRFKRKYSISGQTARQRFYAVRENILEDD